MTNPLVTYLSRGTPVSWAKATVLSVQTYTLTLTWQGTIVPEVPYLSSYTAPAAGDPVQLLLYGASGVLVLGKVLSDPVPPVSTPPDPIDVDPYKTGTYDKSTGLWTAGAARQSLTESEVFVYYQAAFAGLVTETVSGASFQLVVDPQSTKMTSLVLHNNRDLTGELIPVSTPQNVVLVPGTTQDFPIPLYWADQLRTGAAAGIALTSAANTSSAVLATGGRLRFNLL